MSYATTRDSEQLRILDLAIAQFIQRYTSNPTTGKRRTLFLFPGGMGCQLLRARKPYKNNFIGTQTFQYDKIWLTPQDIYRRRAENEDALGRPGDRPRSGGQNHHRETAPSSCSASRLTCNSSTGAITRGSTGSCSAGTGAAVSRTRSRSSSRKFLPHFRNSVQSACGADPLDDFILVGHSFGGMVVNLILRQFNSLLANMTRAVTVSSPFYGYDGQTHRWFEGESPCSTVSAR